MPSSRPDDDVIADIVETGTTLKDNGLVETAEILKVSARLIVNRAAFKLRSAEVPALVERFREAVSSPSGGN